MAKSNLYQGSPSDYIKVITLHNGVRANKDFFDKNPLIRAKYPSQDEFNTTYRTVLQQVKDTGKRFVITISETGIKVTNP